MCFGGGMGQGCVCGCVTGAYMALGLILGSRQGVTRETEAVMAKKKAFEERFLEKYDSLTCAGLLGYDLNLPEERAIVMEKGLMTTLCPGAVRDAIEIARELIDE